MTTSIGRITRLAVGVIAAALGIVLLIVDAPAASADGGMTVHLKQSTVTEYDGCSGFTGAYFVITDVKGDAPASITVTLSDSSMQVVPLLANDGGSAHYSMTADLTTVTVKDATAIVPSDWSGQFNISHCLSATTPPVTTSPTTVTTETTQQTTHVRTTTTITAATQTMTSPVTRTVSSPVTRTVTSPVTQTVTSPVTRTVTRQIQVAGESSSIPPSSSKTSPIQVLGESSSIAPAPSANAHTGQSWGILPYLLFGGGVLLALTGLRVRHGRAH